MTEYKVEVFSIWLDLNLLSLAFYGIIQSVCFMWLLVKIRGHITVAKLKIFSLIFLLSFSLRAMPIVLVSNFFAAHWFTILEVSDQYKSYCSMIIITFLMLAKLCG